MIITLPSTSPAQHHLSAALACGKIQRGATDRLALILKAAYDLGQPQAGDIHPALPAGSPEPVAESDETAAGFGTGAQCELSLRKQRSDVIVAGWLSDLAAPVHGIEGHVRVAEQDWLTRRTPDEAQVPADGDAQRNLFGWQPRNLAPRRLAPNPPEDDPLLPANYTADFENSYRRSATGPVFDAPADRNAGPVPASTVIELAQWVHGHPTEAISYRLRTPAVPGYTAQLRAWCGHGPDTARHWSVAGRIALRCDTLVVHPARHRAVLLWRGDWDRELVTPAHWRAVQILEGGV
ncbi:hypothetical protein GT020_01415 [Glutamicibacter soli]|uniref:Uncharacterized protein n=1 Tax=Glutamicibacter soli TaxID=453836 RepID=A0A6L9G0A4_9MICC|nr:hypothetical protein [Glutamicibacter soli]NAZ14728.1 hypothetical protein [Glutamicibacter soli]